MPQVQLDHDAIIRIESKLCALTKEIDTHKKEAAQKRIEDRRLIWHLYLALTTLAISAVGYLLTRA